MEFLWDNSTLVLFGMMLASYSICLLLVLDEQEHEDLVSTVASEGDVLVSHEGSALMYKTSKFRLVLCNVTSCFE